MKKHLPKSEQFFDVTIERIVPDGFGLAHAENLTIFVPLVCAGDKVRVRVERKKGKVAFTSLIEVLEPSKERVKPPCPYFGRCGGCDFQQMNYETQLASKIAILRDCLRRIGKIDWQDEIKIFNSPAEWHYRTRAQWKHAAGKLGYFERSSHRICDVVECPIIAPALQNTLTDFRQKLRSGALAENFDEIQAVSSGGEVSLKFSEDDNGFDENFYAANKEFAEQARAKTAEEKHAAREIHLTVGKFAYKFSADTFFQVNHGLLLDFIEVALEDFGGETALDLYCGAGLFTLPLAERYQNITGIEGNATSIDFAKRNAESANIENIRFETAAVGNWLMRNAAKLSKVDFVLLDPPRTGAERETIESLINIRPPRIGYVSCNPATLARDLQLLLDDGYNLEKITAFDFFPQTHHVETIAQLKL